MMTLCNTIIIITASCSMLVPGPARYAVMTVGLAGFIMICIRPIGTPASTGRLLAMNIGWRQLAAFMAALPVVIAIYAVALFGTQLPKTAVGIGCAVAALLLAVIFWTGIICVYAVSTQLGIRYRVLGVLLGWIFPLNLMMLTLIIRTVKDETEFETEKTELNLLRATSNICSTKYPVLMVHGIFFRDFKHLNYWARIPRELMKNGATVYYGEQQSAASVMDCGAELAARITEIVRETGCGKVNIIAHSKGGLDARVAITHYSMDSYVASLTTVNTPHRGCIFAEELINNMPQSVVNKVSAAYNAAASRIGDKEPDFLAGVTDLTHSACAAFNQNTPDRPGVLYESIMSYCAKASGGRFPLNMSYHIVKRYDGRNDGLVAVDSAKWGSSFTLLEPEGRRGISHGDVIDLNRENIKGFDVRELYVGIVSSLKKRGF